MFSEEYKRWLLKIARTSIEYFLATHRKFTIPEREVRVVGKQNGAAFVTLTKDVVELRGCVGSLAATKPLYQDIIDNAYSAAFEDPRFFPISAAELPDIAIEISILTEPQPLAFSSPADLLEKLTVGVDGVVVKRGDKSATYLPQVWDEILEKDNFLSSLCLKAGLSPDDWRKPGLQVETYRVEHVSE